MLKATVLLVLLTLKGDGPVGVNFVNFDNLPACRARAEQLQEILEKGGIRVLENRCLEGFQWFARHRHRRSKGGAGKPAPRYLYLVVTSPGRVVVLPQKEMAECERRRQALTRAAWPRKAWCAYSEQRLLARPPVEKGRGRREGAEQGAGSSRSTGLVPRKGR
jgi:hypothetical protein